MIPKLYLRHIGLAFAFIFLLVYLRFLGYSTSTLSGDTATTKKNTNGNSEPLKVTEHHVAIKLHVPTDVANMGDSNKGSNPEGSKEGEQKHSANVNVVVEGTTPSNTKDEKTGKERPKAAFVTLARNEDLFLLVESIRHVEDRFNRKYHYDWVFFNDVQFTTEFIELTNAIVSGRTKFEVIPKEQWGYPEWADLKKVEQSKKTMKARQVVYGELDSYRHMCRFESGFFYRSPALAEYDWYWRVEPGISISCDLDYDLFEFMQENNKTYGFTISIHEFESTIPTLWDHVKEFMKNHPEHIAQNNLLDFVSDDGGYSYNLCHFWSNFEVGSLHFWRSKAYSDFFEYLDSSGGFFYERWGDAPVHSIAAALFLDRNQVHYFGDVGYKHGVYGQCPLNAQERYAHKCTCDPTHDFTFDDYSCGKKYYDVMKMKKPEGV